MTEAAVDRTEPARDAAAGTAAAGQERWTRERVLWIGRWGEGLLSFRTSRPAGYRFVAGRYARLGLADAAGGGVWRPFSMVSAPDDPYLEFLVVLVPGGEFSQRLEKVREGDDILVERLNYGFLTVDQLAPGKDLWLLASGTGVGPFVSILRDARTWQDFEHLVLAHSVRRAADLAYRDALAGLGSPAGAAARLHYLPIVTREQIPGLLHARIPSAFADGGLERQAGMTLDVSRSRVMVCGNPDLTREMRVLLAARGFVANRRGAPGQMTFEKYW
ncbi:MAG: ferredoxin--NADP reductase [Rhodocyclales bacterium]|nr:ferredoxin--NADP reductase [Rhodocyclales bacterium]